MGMGVVNIALAAAGASVPLVAATSPQYFVSETTITDPAGSTQAFGRFGHSVAYGYISSTGKYDIAVGAPHASGTGNPFTGINKPSSSSANDYCSFVDTQHCRRDSKEMQGYVKTFSIDGTPVTTFEPDDSCGYRSMFGSSVKVGATGAGGGDILAASAYMCSDKDASVYTEGIESPDK